MLNTLLFIYDNVKLFVFIVITLIIAYSWISMFIHKDHKFIAEYSRKYKDRVLTTKDLDIIECKIKNMEGRQFEIFCNWLFKNMGKYESVTLTPERNDKGRDLILVDRSSETTLVECKRYTDKATITEEFMIGREICQKLIGAMVVDNVKKGIVITTGNVHQNAWDYINKLEKNTDIRIEIMNLDDIMKVIQEINSAEVLNVVLN